MDTPHRTLRFVPPKDQEEAERKRIELETAIADIDLRLQEPVAGPRVNITAAPARRTYTEWRAAAIRSRKKLNAELTLLNQWISRMNPANALGQKRLSDLFGEAYRLLLSVAANGYQFSEPERELMNRIDKVFPRLKQFSGDISKEGDMLAIARSCRKGAAETVARIGLSIFMATRDPQDLEVLVENHAAAPNPESKVQTAIALIRAYVAAGMIEEASATARGIPTSAEATAIQAWALVAKASGRDDDWNRATLLIPQLRIDARPKCWYYLLEASQNLTYAVEAKKALRDWLEERPSSRDHIDGSRRSMIHSLLSFGQIIAARTVAQEIFDGPLRCSAFAVIAQESGDADDLSEALHYADTINFNKKLSGLRQLVDAAIKCKHLDQVWEIAKSLSPSARCVALSRVIIHTTGTVQATALASARKAASQIKSSDSDGSYALSDFVRGLLAVGHVDEAAKTAVSISHVEICCETCLLVHQAQHT